MTIRGWILTMTCVDLALAIFTDWQLFKFGFVVLIALLCYVHTRWYQK